MTPLHGQPRATEIIRAYLENPKSCAFLLHGPTGTGKTLTAHNLAEGLGVDAKDIENVGQTTDAVRKLAKSLGPQLADRKWRCVVINECDCMRKDIQKNWNGILECLPSHVVVIFCAISLEKLSQGFRDRCSAIEFVADREHVRKFAQDEWSRRMPGQAAPDYLKGAGCRPNCTPSYRLAQEDVDKAIQFVDKPDVADFRQWIVHDGSIVWGNFGPNLESSARILRQARIRESQSGCYYLARTSETDRKGGRVPADASNVLIGDPLSE